MVVVVVVVMTVKFGAFAEAFEIRDVDGPVAADEDAGLTEGGEAAVFAEDCCCFGSLDVLVQCPGSDLGFVLSLAI